MNSHSPTAITSPAPPLDLWGALNQHSIIVCSDADGVITHVNDLFVEVSGYTPEEIVGDSHHIFISDGKPDEFFNELRHTIVQGEIWRGEVLNRAKDGTTYWTRTTAVPQVSRGVEPAGQIFLQEKIAAPKSCVETNPANGARHRQRFLEPSHAMDLMEATFETSYSGLLVTGEDGTILKSNTLFGDLWGVGSDAIDNHDGRSLLDHISTLLEDPEGFRMDAEALRSQPQAVFDDELRLRDGRVLSIDSHPLELGDATVARIWSFRDVTDQARMAEWETQAFLSTAVKLAIARELAGTGTLEERLERSLQHVLRLEEVQILQKGCLFLADDDETELRLCGHSGDIGPEFFRDGGRVSLGRDLGERGLCERAAVSREILVSENCQTDRRQGSACSHPLPHGHLVIPLLGTFAGHTTTLGVLYLFSAVNPAITDEQRNLLREIGGLLSTAVLQDRARKAIEHGRQVAEQATRSKAEFLANMSHEIRTPLNGVIGMAQLLVESDLTDVQYHRARTVKSSGEALLRLVNDILDYSKIEAGQLVMEVVDFDLMTLLGDFGESMALRAQERGLELVMAPEPEVPIHLQGDPGRLQQVLTNLVGNALKFTHEGEVAVHVLLESESDDEVQIRFSVRDTGIGIPKDRQEAMFEKFTQVDASTTRKYGGTGLGLAISRQLAVAMGGEIGVESTEGEGSDFSFTARFLKSTSGVEVEPTDLGGVRILVVDDNESNREFLRTHLVSWGAKVDDAPDGETALRRLTAAKLADDPFKVAVLDLEMPVMGGEELGQSIKGDAVLSSTHLVAMPPPTESEDIEQLEHAGFLAYHVKPVRVSDLSYSLSTILAPGYQAAGIITRHTIREGPAAPRELCPGHVLLAEDNLVNQMVARAFLEKLGLTVDVAANGVEALAAMESTAYDMVFMDMQMPEMDGVTATRRIRASTLNYRDIPIVAMTANAMAGDRDRCLEAGMNDYLSKPLVAQELAGIVAQWLSAPTQP